MSITQKACPVVQVSGLAKTFSVKQKAPGLRGSWQALWRPQTRAVTAVADITFSLEEGEMLAFIGPNGAGKSTTIKMLTGILYPSQGQASVLGYTPWQERRRLGYHIGSVFGQKPQLWYHLPPEDTFRLFARIYELDMKQFWQRRDFLVESFQIEDLLQVPVRKLSLGQRMKCEIAKEYGEPYARLAMLLNEERGWAKATLPTFHPSTSPNTAKPHSRKAPRRTAPVKNNSDHASGSAAPTANAGNEGMYVRIDTIHRCWRRRTSAHVSGRPLTRTGRRRR
jgi:ABC-type transport system involved in cytochrome c biogenesis ATPase subunit